MSRIYREFSMKEYERRFEVKLEVVISAIIGEEFASKEIANHSREQKVVFNLKQEYLQKVKICRTFDFIESKTKVKTRFTSNNTSKSLFSLDILKQKLKINITFEEC